MKKKILLTLALAYVCTLSIWGKIIDKNDRIYDFAYGGVIYEILSEQDKTVAVVGFDWGVPDDCVIPSQVEYDSETYTVTRLNRTKLENSFSSNGFTEDSAGYGNTGPIPVKLTIPGTVKTISDDIISYYQASNLRELIIEDGDLEDIGKYAFFYCKNLNIIQLPPNLKKIGDYAFDMASYHLSEVKLPDSLEELGKYAFGFSYSMDCELRQSINDEIDTRASDYKFHTLILPNSLVKIGKHALERRYWDLSSSNAWNNVILPCNLKRIEDNTFELISLPELIIPNSVKTIGIGNFDIGHSELQTLTLGMSVENVYEKSFGDAPNLKEFYCLPSTPPSFVFYGFNPDATVLVPPGKIDTYRNAEGWNHFSNFKELPNVLIQFQIHSYSISKDESAELRYIVSNLGDVEITKEEWLATRPDGSDAADAISVEDGYVKGLLQGDYYLTLKVTDSSGQEYSAQCVVLVDSNGSGIDQIASDDDTNPDLAQKIFNLQGVYMGNNATNLSSGIYIVNSNGKSRKIFVNK